MLVIFVHLYLVFEVSAVLASTQQVPLVIDLYHWVLRLRTESRRIGALLRFWLFAGPKSNNRFVAVSYGLRNFMRVKHKNV